MYKKHKIHFVGIGGIGMSGIAEVLLNLGYPVSGSDLKRSATMTRLKKLGATLFYGHKTQNVHDAQVVVISSAVKADNPEVVEAVRWKIPVIPRAEMLAELMRFSRYGVAVSGTHGKTTTTSLVAQILHSAGLDPTLVIGGKVNNFKSNARLGKGSFMVAEADESDGSFLKLSPTISIITNIDREHMDFYKDFEAVKKAYLEFANRVPFYGAVVCCVDHPVVCELISKVEKRVITYGLTPGAQYTARNIEPLLGQVSYDLVVHGEPKGRLTLNMPGRHNVLNSLAAIAVGQELDISLKKIDKALTDFQGVERRCQILLQNKFCTVVDDYGHHPEEIKATLKTIKEFFKFKRLICLFQPHRYSRTHDLYHELILAFDDVDQLLLTDIYPAGEKPIADLSSQKLADDLKKRITDKVLYLPKNSQLIQQVASHVQEGDLLLTLGAGDVTKMGKEIARILKKIK